MKRVLAMGAMTMTLMLGIGLVRADSTVGWLDVDVASPPRRRSSSTMPR